MKIKENNLVDFEEFVNKEYGSCGTTCRERFEEGYEAFKLGVMLQEVCK